MFLLPGRLRRGASLLFEFVRAASAAGVVNDSWRVRVAVCGLHCLLCVLDAVRVARYFLCVVGCLCVAAFRARVWVSWFVQLVFAMSRLSCALLALASSRVFASDWQAGKPLEVHVDYDVPASSSGASSVLRGRGRVQPFSAMSLRSGGGVVPEQGTDVTVHVPSVAVGAGERAAWLSGLQSDVAALAAVERSQAASEERVRGIARAPEVRPAQCGALLVCVRVCARA